MKKLVFMLSVLIVLTSCGHSDKPKGPSQCDIYEEFFEKYDEAHPDYYESEDGWRDFKNEFAKEMTTNIDFAKATCNSFKYYGNYFSTLYFAESTGMYKSMESDEWGDFKKFFYLHRIHGQYFGFYIVSMIPSTAERHDLPNIGQADLCLETSDSKFKTIELQGETVYVLGEYLIAKEGKLIGKEETKVEEQDSTNQKEFRIEVSSIKDISGEIFSTKMMTNKVESFLEDKKDIYILSTGGATYGDNENSLLEYIRYKSANFVSNSVIAGETCISFVVGTDGKVGETFVVKNIGGYGDKFADIIKSMPKWKPAKVEGKTVKSIVTISINFETY